MSWSDLAVAAVAVACFYLLWWCRSLAGRLGHIERQPAEYLCREARRLGSNQTLVADVSAAADADPSLNVPEEILCEPAAGRVAARNRASSAAVSHTPA